MEEHPDFPHTSEDVGDSAGARGVAAGSQGAEEEVLLFTFPGKVVKAYKRNKQEMSFRLPRQTIQFVTN